MPVVRPAFTETTALGAAYLAGQPTGTWSDLATVARQSHKDARFSPRIDTARRARCWAGGAAPWNAAGTGRGSDRFRRTRAARGRDVRRARRRRRRNGARRGGRRRRARLPHRADRGRGLASATSSRSTKLIHGGVRYLQQGNLGLVREALRERTILRRNAPHLVGDSRSSSRRTVHSRSHTTPPGSRHTTCSPARRNFRAAAWSAPNAPAR